MPNTYYARDDRFARGGWTLWKRCDHGGDRQLAVGMGEQTARRVARLLNEDENRNAMLVVTTADSTPD